MPLRFAPLAILALLAGSAPLLGSTCASPPPPPPALAPLPQAGAGVAVSYQEDVRPVLEARCVVCHGCYDAPCQLDLSAAEGVQRGASKQAVYSTDRLSAMQPTRLFVDAQTPEAWRSRGFFSVVEGEGAPEPGALLLRMLALGRAHPFAPDAKLPETLALAFDRTLSCPASEEFDAYAAEHPLGGMPYGTAPLADAELGVLAAWVAAGAPASPAPSLPAKAAAQVAQWEEFLNGESLKQRITARYLYEHWFLAHLYFEDLPAGPFFRIVRSTTPPTQPIDEIATRRPFGSPGEARFWYRLHPIEQTLVHKTHIVYQLGAARMRRLTQLFLTADWEPTRLPGYEPAEASNPFTSFDQIPARSRYQFLLDDAHYFVMTFIRGPVCRGQVAVDVIEDRFFAVFLDPDHDPSVVDPGFLERTKQLLALPAEHGSGLTLEANYVGYSADQRRYLEEREKYYDRIDPQRRGPSLDFVWDGDGRNTNALLTIARNFDNATVVRGFLGGMPKTAWMIDYPIFERIYYNLVAGYDVFGTLTHQVSTRLYMDHLRMQSENLFLNFLPADRRDAIRAGWYVGATRQLDYFFVDRLRTNDHGTQIPFRSKDPKAELLAMILARSAAVAGPPDLLNRCAAPSCDRPGASASERRAERALRRLAGARGGFVALLPELTLLRVRTDTGDALYTLVHDRAHTNVAFMFGEDDRLVPADDELTLARGVFGSYPNFLFEVPLAELDAFVDALRALGDPADLEALATRFGVRRTSPRFWRSFDWVRDELRRAQPTEAAVLDLNRYENL